MTDYAMPAPPPLAIDTLWDVYGDQWCRVDEPLAANADPADTAWVPHGTPFTLTRLAEAALDWPDLVYEYGPLSDTDPKEPS